MWGEPGDVDGDGFADHGGSVSFGFGGSVVMPGGVLGDLDASTAIADLDTWWAYVVPDLNGDGLGEVIAYDDDYHIGLRLGGTALGGASSPRRFADFWTYEDAADVDGDGLTDLIVCDVGDYTCYVIREPDIPSGTSPTSAVAWLTITGVKVLTAIDLNGDGGTDLVGGNDTINRRHRRRVRPSTAPISPLPPAEPLDASAAIAAWESDGLYPTVYNYGSDVRNVGDVDGDGYDDLIIGTSPRNSTISTTIGLSELAYGGP